MADNSDDEAAVVLLSLIGEVIAQKAALRRMQQLLLQVREHISGVSADSLAHADLHHDLASVARLVPCENDESAVIRNYARLFLHQLHVSQQSLTIN